MINSARHTPGTRRVAALPALAGTIALLAALAGCGSAAQPSATPELTVRPTATGSSKAPSGPATSSSKPTKAEKIEAGTEAIRAYRQMIFDLYADHSLPVTDMKKVASTGLAKKDMTAIKAGRDKGWVDSPGTVHVKWVRPVFVKATQMRLFACVDPTAIDVTRGSDTGPAERFAADYSLEAVEGAWLVSAVRTHNSAPEVSPC